MDEIVIYKINQIINSKLTCYIRKHLNMQHNNIPLTYKVHKPQKSLILIGIILSTLSFTRCADLPIPANRLENPIINPADELNILETEALTLINSIKNGPEEQKWQIMVEIKNKLLEIIEKEKDLLFSDYFRIIDKWLDKDRVLKLEFYKASIDRDTAGIELLQSITKSSRSFYLQNTYKNAEETLNRAKARYYERVLDEHNTIVMFKGWKENKFAEIRDCVDNWNNGRLVLDYLFFHIECLRELIVSLKRRIDVTMSSSTKMRSKDEISIIEKEYVDTLRYHIGKGKSDIEVEIINRGETLIGKFEIYMKAEYEMMNHEDIRQLQLKLRKIVTDIYSEIKNILKDVIDASND